MPHPDEGLIHAWLDGELGAVEAARVEALVASDPAWAAAAAEARGLIAAGARIVGALDRVPANVIPKAVAPRLTSRAWMWRAAAALVVIAGSAVVLERRPPELPAPNRAPQSGAAPSPPVSRAPAPAAAPAVKKARPEAAAKAQAQASDIQSVPSLKVLDDTKQTVPVPETAVVSANAAATAGAEASAAAAAAAARRARALTAAAAPAAPAVLPPPEAALARSFAEDRTTRLPVYCFEQREPRDSARWIIRLDSGALADSIRLERLARRGDTLAAVNGRLIAISVRCPAP